MPDQPVKTMSVDEVYSELLFEFYIETHDLNNLSDDEQNELINLYNNQVI